MAPIPVFVGGQQFYISHDLLTKLGSRVDGDGYIDRSACCFPIIVEYNQGYNLRSGRIAQIAADWRLPESEVVEQLWEDVNYYEFAGMRADLAIFISRCYPELAFLTSVYDATSDYDYDEATVDFCARFWMFCEIWIRAVCQYPIFGLAHQQERLLRRCREIFVEEKFGIVLFYRWLQGLRRIPLIFLVGRIIISALIYHCMPGTQSSQQPSQQHQNAEERRG